MNEKEGIRLIPSFYLETVKGSTRPCGNFSGGRPMAANYFNYTEPIRAVCSDMVFRLPVFSQIRMENVAVSLGRTRRNDMYGVYASMTPLRFKGGELRGKRNNRLLEIPPLYDKERRPILYVLSIYIPRFVNLPIREKIDTLIHELYHISPSFDGSLRSFGGRFYAHGASQKEYNRKVSALSRQWLSGDPRPELWDFLRYDFKTLCERYGGLTGETVRIPPLKVIR